MLSFLNLEFDHARQSWARVEAPSSHRFAVTTCASRPELFEPSVELENEVWDELSFLDYTAAHYSHYDHLLEKFPEYRLCMIELATDELVATGMCVPLHAQETDRLPDEGWDWIVETAELLGARNANAIGALSISVSARHRDKGFARELIYMMRALASLRSLPRVIAPVRPSLKCHHPFVPMAEYIAWRDERGRIYDPWLRSHLAAGGRMTGVCRRSMVVEQPLEFWKRWTSRMPESATELPFKGALVPLEIDHATGKGRYVEPNVWVTHEV